MMKKGALAAAALAGGVGAALHGHGHGNLFAKRNNVCTPQCTTVWSVVTGEPTLVPGTQTVPAASPAPTTTITVVSLTPAYQAPPSPQHPAINGAPVPPGVHTFPATTVTITKATTVCAALSYMATPGTQVTAGITTVVKSASADDCPVATIYNPGTYVAPPRVVTVTKTGYVYYCPLSKLGNPTSTPVPAFQPTETALPPPPASTQEAPAPSTTEAAPLPIPPVVSNNEEMPAVPHHQKVPAVETHVELPVAPPQKEVPVAPTYKQPVAPVYPQPAAPVHSQPAAPVYPQPAAPVHDQPAAPVYPQPAAPVHSQPAAPVQKQPSSTPKPGNSGSSGKLVSDNDHFGITYTPYESSNGECKAAEQVDKDIAELKQSGFTTVRVYSTDCHTLEYVGNACQKHGVHMIVGIFVKDSGCSYDTPAIKEQIDELSTWDKWNMVSLVVVGNEAIMNGHCSPRQLRDLIKTVKSKCSSYKGKYTISETLNVWQRPDVKSEICGVVDVTGANIHPYFNSNVSPESAGEFVAGQLDLLSKICNHNEVINLECGWPTRGNCNGKACPGSKEQATAMKSIREKTGHKTVFFSFKNDEWKKPGSCGCEQSWGTAALFRAESSY